MRINEFRLERYFAAHEFKVRYLLSASDCEGLSLDELLGLADDETLALWRGLMLGYTESQGHPLLRQEIGRLYANIAADDVLVAAPEEAIFVAMNVLLQPDDHVLATFPGYQSLYEIARSLGCQVTPWSLEAVDDGWQLDLDFLQRRLTPQTRLLVVNFPHNPTGYQPAADALAAIVAFARRHGLWLFSDEMYRLLEYDPADRLPSVADLYERGIALAGLSKSFALAGLRIGWLATRDRDLLARCMAFKDYTTICSSAPSEILGIMALRSRQPIINRNLAIIRANLALANRFFAAHPDLFRWLPPRAGSIAFPQLRSHAAVADFCQDVLEKKSLMILPGDVFDYAGNHFRVGLGRRNFADALAALEECVRG
ncbi:MAG: aminotransferase class I/II-fold pyridoxal phosphate-dependent enzyme [Chloroflexi bacterium]|nr:aminotransferase class I/II-fold pyridoxal phosphate-dependent enzyme [Chloroflexota bacterium]